jgi:hypothetical protein
MIDTLPLFLGGALMVALTIVGFKMAWNSSKVIYRFANSLWDFVVAMVSISIIVYAVYVVYMFMRTSGALEGEFTWSRKDMEKMAGYAQSSGSFALEALTSWISSQWEGFTAGADTSSDA